ncbi:MAG TPA: hypothetical protein VFL96_16120 [Acidobacteriaceae bacterium]|jgi:hypothetical protein|nr:hypothetical protein [Acidobacteriaceae bacterium]
MTTAGISRPGVAKISAFPTLDAVHEVGHFLAAIACGHRCVAAAVNIDGMECLDSGKPIVGKFIGDFNVYPNNTPQERAVMSVAGACAEAAVALKAGKTIIPSQIISWISPSDWRTSGLTGPEDPGLGDAIEAAFRMFAQPGAMDMLISLAWQLDQQSCILTADAAREWLGQEPDGNLVMPGKAVAEVMGA